MTMPDRVAFSLFGKDVYWYGVLLAAGMVIAVLLAYREERRKKLKKDTVIDMCLAIIPSGVIGARLFYVLFELENYLDNPISMLYIWEGGLAIYGAVIGGLLAAFIFAKVRKVRFLKLADVIAPGLVLAQAIGRWGNFFNQEAFGLPVTEDMLQNTPILGFFPLSVPIEGAHYFDKTLCTACAVTASGAHLHLATFFYESLWCVLVFLFVWLNRKRFKHDGDAFLWYALLYSFERAFVEGLRGDSLWLIQPSAPGLTDGVRVSQAISAVLFIAVLAFMLVRHFREKKLGVLIWPSPLPVAETDEGEASDAQTDNAIECDIIDGDAIADDIISEADERDETESPNEEIGQPAENAETTEENNSDEAHECEADDNNAENKNADETDGGEL